MGLNVNSRAYVGIRHSKELNQIKSFLEEFEKVLVLGGGSNILFTKDFNGLVLHNCIAGIDILKENQDFVWLKIGGGVEWDSLVKYTVNNQYYGIENLSMIPGSVGAAPVQNIGAYGTELKDVFDSLECYHLKNDAWLKLNKDECQFAYRDSVFKQELKNQVIITSVTLKLSKTKHFNLSYKALADYLAKEDHLSLDKVSRAVRYIRSSKLPNPKEIGNTGSFFKNPIVHKEIYKKLSQDYDNIPFYEIDNESVKIPAGWLIEQCGWKGFRDGDAGVYDKQALVLVNYGNAKASDLLNLVRNIQNSVSEKFDINLINEVNMI